MATVTVDWVWHSSYGEMSDKMVNIRKSTNVQVETVGGIVIRGCPPYSHM